MLGTFSPEEDTYLSSEQRLMLMAIDPKYKDKYEKLQTQEDSIDLKGLEQLSDSFDNKLPNRGATSKKLDLTPEDQGESLGSSGSAGVKGGFIQAIIPFIPLIASVLPSIISGIKSIFSKRKAPAGAGVDAEVAVNTFLQKNGRQLVSIENSLSSMRPKEAWKTVHDVSKDITESVLEQLPLPEGSDERFVAKLAEVVANKAVPKSFLASISKEKMKERKAGSGQSLTSCHMALPVIKYGLRKLIGDPDVTDEVYQRVKEKMKEGEGLYDGGKVTWDKVKTFAKKAFYFALPIIKELTGKLITREQVKPLISGLLDKFEYLKPYSNSIADVAVSPLSKSSGTGMISPPQLSRAKGDGFISSPQMTGSGKKKVSLTHRSGGYVLKVF
jgi:hypothetical protein